MQSITYTNELGQSLTFGNTFPFLFVNIDASSLGKTEETFKAYAQDGQTTGITTYNPRTIICNLILAIDGVTSYRQNWQRICSVLAPKLKGTLYYTNEIGTYKIDCSTFEIPKIEQQQFAVQFVADYPFWQASEDICFRLGSIVGGFSFPFSFPVSFGTWVKSCTIENDTGIDTPLKIEMTTVSDYCKITNEKGEFIKVDKPVADGQKLVIDTYEGKVKLYSADGSFVYANNKVTLDSTYFTLHNGTNILTLDNGQTTPAIATICYNKLYTGV